MLAETISNFTCAKLFDETVPFKFTWKLYLIFIILHAVLLTRCHMHTPLTLSKRLMVLVANTRHRSVCIRIASPKLLLYLHVAELSWHPARL